MRTRTHPAVADYLGEVRAGLADLPQEELVEIIQDVEAHLAEVADELGDALSTRALEARLGPPASYTAELRSSAGYTVSRSNDRDTVEDGGSAHRGRVRARLSIFGWLAFCAVFFLAGFVAYGGGGRPVEQLAFVAVLLAGAGLAVVARRQGAYVSSLPEVRAIAGPLSRLLSWGLTDRPQERPQEEEEKLCGGAGHGPGREISAGGAWRRRWFALGMAGFGAGVVWLAGASLSGGNESYILPAAAAALLGLVIAVAAAPPFAAEPAAGGWSVLPHRMTDLPRGLRRAMSAVGAAVWAVRAWGALLILDRYVVTGWWDDPQGSGFPLPRYFGVGAAGGLAVLALAVLVSVLLGRQERRLGRWRALVVPFDVVLLATLVVALLHPEYWTG